MKNRIGINKEKATGLIDKLNELLAGYQVYYQNLRGFHWNIKGDKFFELHVKFEELYNEAQLAIDEVAERILTLGGTPFHTFSDYLANASLKEAKNLSSASETVGTVIENNKTLLELERNVISIADEAGDEGTIDQMSGYIKAQEKLIWMLSAFLAPVNA